MGMHADCGHGIIMATSMAQLHMQAMTVEGAGVQLSVWFVVCVIAAVHGWCVVQHMLLLRVPCFVSFVTLGIWCFLRVTMTSGRCHGSLLQL